MAIAGYNTDYARALRLRIAEEIAARAREEARSLAAEAELARVRAEAERVLARLGGELLRAEQLQEESERLRAELAECNSALRANEGTLVEVAAQRDAARRDLDNALTAIEELLAGRA